MSKAASYDRTINKYIASLEEQITSAMSQLLQWNQEIKTKNIPVKDKIKS